MNLLIKIILFYVFHITFYIQTLPQTTPNIYQRVALLKKQIEIQIARNNDQLVKETTKDIYDVLEDIEPITPILRPKKYKKESIRFRPVRTTTYKPEINATKKKIKYKPRSVIRNVNVKNVNVTGNVTVKIGGKNYKEFYRRVYPNYIENHEHWVHCQDLITPFFHGHKTNMRERKRLSPDDFVVLRIIQLLDDISQELTKEDIQSLMYQISMLQLRLFQWDTGAIGRLLEAITDEPFHRLNFRTIKIGIKRLFNAFHLDVSDTSTLIKQSMIFRPPCVMISKYEGSTKKLNIFTEPHSTTKRTTNCIKKKNNKCEND